MLHRNVSKAKALQLSGYIRSQRQLAPVASLTKCNSDSSGSSSARRRERQQQQQLSGDQWSARRLQDVGALTHPGAVLRRGTKYTYEIFLSSLEEAQP